MPQTCRPLAPAPPMPTDAARHWRPAAGPSAPPSKVWRICQGEPVAEANAGRLARHFGRLGEFLDRHVLQTLIQPDRDAAAPAKTSARPDNDR